MRTLLTLVLGLLLGMVGYHYLGATADAGPAPAVAAPQSRPLSPSTTAGDPATVVPGVTTTPSPDTSPPAATAAPAAPPPGASGNAADPGGLLLPVQGIAREQLHDTFSDARSEGRVHDAIDILAAEGTPVLAVADGTVEKLFDSERGGLTVYQFEPGGKYCYYYAHLQRYADGLAEKQPVRRGQVIGYVGSTGNASAEAPHLHFEIHRLGPERHWWQGEALNPYPLLMSGRLPE